MAAGSMARMAVWALVALGAASVKLVGEKDEDAQGGEPPAADGAPIVSWVAPGQGGNAPEDGGFGRCADPSWTADDEKECLATYQAVQCAILEGAHLDAQNETRYYLENLWLPTNYLGGVKQDKALTKWGDIPPDIGVCTDTVIRSLRNAGIDLQWLVYRDMKKDQGKPKAKQSYPWGSFKKKVADPNIDHRRCPNLEAFLKLHALSLTTGTGPEHLDTWQAGDIVYWDLMTGRFHIGIVSDQVGPSGLPMVFHNFPSPGYSCEEDVLDGFLVAGHYRFPAPGAEVPLVPVPGAG